MRNQDETEFIEFAATAVRRLRRTAYLMCGDWYGAEDAAQDALIKIYRRWRHINRSGDLTSYSHRVVVNAVYDQARRPWRREHVDDGGTETGSLDVITPVDNRLMVVQALKALPPGQRACVVLRHYADLSIEQTADVLGISPGGVKSQTSHGLAQLRDLLGAARINSVERTACVT
jgi:RNA polymerase sigma-70 factor (sigma-E family)